MRSNAAGWPARQVQQLLRVTPLRVRQHQQQVELIRTTAGSSLGRAAHSRRGRPFASRKRPGPRPPHRGSLHSPAQNRAHPCQQFGASWFCQGLGAHFPAHNRSLVRHGVSMTPAAYAYVGAGQQATVAPGDQGEDDQSRGRVHRRPHSVPLATVSPRGVAGRTSSAGRGLLGHRRRLTGGSPAGFTGLGQAAI